VNVYALVNGFVDAYMQFRLKVGELPLWIFVGLDNGHL
jgi:hypothetical protein